MLDNKNKIIVVLVALIVLLIMLGRCNKPIELEPDVTIIETIKTDTIYITKPPVVITEYVRVNQREQVFINNRDTIHTFADCDVDSIIIKGEDKIIENTITIEKTIRDRQLHHLMLGGDINTRLDLSLIHI